MKAAHIKSRMGMAAVLVSALLVGACMRSFNEERQLDNASFLSFPELRSIVDVQLTGVRDYTFKAVPGKKNRYEVEAGTYRLVATRDGVVVHEVRIFVSAGQTKPIEVR